MMNTRTLFTIILFTFYAFIPRLCSAQATAQTVQKEFIPENKSNISNDDYVRAKGLLRSNYQNIRENQGKVNYANYWNKAFAYATMDYEKDSIFDNLVKSRKVNSKSF